MRSFEEEQRRERRREPARRDGDLRDGALVPTVYGSPMPAETSFLGVHLAVADMAAAMAFYRLAGLPVPDGADGEGHVQLDVGGGVHIAFSTPAVIGMYDPGWRGPSTATATVLQLRLASEAAGQAGGFGQLFGEGLRISALSPKIPIDCCISSVTLDRALFIATGAMVSIAGIVAALLIVSLTHALRLYAMLFAVILISLLFGVALAILLAHLVTIRASPLPMAMDE